MAVAAANGNPELAAQASVESMTDAGVKEPEIMAAAMEAVGALEEVNAHKPPLLEATQDLFASFDDKVADLGSASGSGSGSGSSSAEGRKY